MYKYHFMLAACCYNISIKSDGLFVNPKANTSHGQPVYRI